MLDRDREKLYLLTDNMENRRIVWLSFLREKERQDKKLNVDLDEEGQREFEERMAFGRAELKRL